MCSSFKSSGKFYLSTRQLRKHLFGNNWNWPLFLDSHDDIWFMTHYWLQIHFLGGRWIPDSLRSLSFLFNVSNTSLVFHLHLFEINYLCKSFFIQNICGECFPILPRETAYISSLRLLEDWKTIKLGNFIRNSSFLKKHLKNVQIKSWILDYLNWETMLKFVLNSSLK